MSEQIRELDHKLKNGEITKEEYIKMKFENLGCKSDKEFWNEIKHKLENTEREDALRKWERFACMTKQGGCYPDIFRYEHGNVEDVVLDAKWFSKALERINELRNKIKGV